MRSSKDIGRKLAALLSSAKDHKRRNNQKEGKCICGTCGGREGNSMSEVNKGK